MAEAKPGQDQGQEPKKSNLGKLFLPLFAALNPDILALAKRARVLPLRVVQPHQPRRRVVDVPVELRIAVRVDSGPRQ